MDGQTKREIWLLAIGTALVELPAVRRLYDPQPLSLPDGQLTADVGRYPFTGCGVEAHSP